MAITRVHLIVNPASGRGDVPLREFNRVMHEHDVCWTMSNTCCVGDAELQAKMAVHGGVQVVAVYGGDGTIHEAARGLQGSAVPLAVIPGGSANVLASDFTLPDDITEAARLLLGLDHDGVPPTRRIDAGCVNQRDLFVLRAEVGMQADMLTQTDREAKELYGAWAYWLSTLRQLREPPVAWYTIQLNDGNTFDIEAVTAIVTNLAGMGSSGRELCPDIEPDDGKLDLILIEPRHVESLLSMTRSLTQWLRDARPFPHHQAARIRLATQPAQTVTYDGEPRDTPELLDIRVWPNAIKLVCPPRV